MKKKSIKYLVSFLTLFIYLGILFTFSSKGKPDLVDQPNLCNDPSLSRSIAINFESPNNANWARQPNFQGHIPYPDLRTGGLPGAILMVKDKWHAKITVTSPQCPDFIWEYVLQTGSNVVNIQVPPADFDFHLEVVYWETYDAPYNVFDFNITPPFGGQTNAGRLVHIYEYTFLGPWNSGVTQPIYLSPSHLVADMNPWGDGGGGNNKPTGIEDYTDANDFIANRGN